MYILVLCDFALRMPQRVSPEDSFNVAAMCRHLEERALKAVVSHYEDPALPNLVSSLAVEWCWPATSIYKEYRNLVNSTLPALAMAGVRMVPQMAHFLSYENKLMQGMVAQMLRLENAPLSFSIGTVEGFWRAAKALGYPFVVKRSEGWGSEGVGLIRNEEDAKEYVARWFAKRSRASRGFGAVVAQQFYPGLLGDWKIIVVGDVAAALWRSTRPGDFRASGSGLFEFKQPPQEVLEFAYQTVRRVKAPWGSIDVAEYEGKPVLIEYQIVHFGTTTCDRAPFHFRRQAAGEWEEISGPVPMEEAMVTAVVSEIQSHEAAAR